MTRADPSTGLDPATVLAAQKGDAEALHRLVAAAYPLVYRWVRIRLGDDTEVDDVSQDVMVRVLRRLGSFNGRGKFTTWLYPVVRNTVIDHARRRTRIDRTPRTEPPVGHAIPSDGEGPEDALERREKLRLLRSYLRELPERQRVVMDLADFQGLPARDIAEMLGIEPVSVRVHLFKARRTLRTRITENHPELVEDTP